MRCFFAILVAVGAAVAWMGPVAGAEESRDFELPPVKLKPERPPAAKPIPPAPDERTPPAAEPQPPTSSPAEKPGESLPAKPARTPRTAPKAATSTPPAAEPSAPPAEPPPTVIAKPIRTEAPPETALPPLLPLPPQAAPGKPAEVATPAVPPRGPRPEDVQKEAIEAQVRPLPEADLSGMGEVGLAEEVARARKAYLQALMALRDLYVARGTAAKIEWVNSEIEAFQKVPKIQYLSVAEMAGPDLRPSRRIAAADQLFEEGMHYKNYPAFPPGKKDYLKIALDKFQTIIEKYPESDKIDDAAFRMGEIYGGWYFQDFPRAVECYQRCWEWNPQTEYPALFNAAKIYEEKLRNGVKAVELYNRVIAEYPNEDLKKQAVDRIKALTGK